MEEALVELVRETGPYALVALFGASLIEYVFPPFPGDSIVILGAFYATHGELPLAAVFLAVTLGSVVGSAIDYAIGRRLGSAAERRVPESPRRFRWAGLDRLHRVEAAYRRHGDLYILINRFLPGVRGFFFVAAGMAGMPFRRVILLGALSAALWNALLLAAGWAVGENLDRLVALFRTYSFVAWGGLFLVATGLLVRWVLGRKKSGKRPSSQ
ncbi:DedA family protein [Vulgatibacter sp.]|uniref:DedA family protein n=1 Tax=Vulgatibacter sp. TaxID=1971226 RepID=UPI00356329E4